MPLPVDFVLHKLSFSSRLSTSHLHQILLTISDYISQKILQELCSPSRQQVEDHIWLTTIPVSQSALFSILSVRFFCEKQREKAVMPFHDFVIRRPGVLSGGISKPHVSSPGRQFSTPRLEKLDFPSKPQVNTEEPRQNIKVKIEPVDDCDGDYEPGTAAMGLSFHDDQQQSGSSSYENIHDDSKEFILPSIEQSPSPESLDTAVKQQELSSFFDLINGLRGGSGRGTPAKKKETPRKVTPRKATRPSTGQVVSLDSAVTFPAQYNSNLEWIIPKEVEDAYQELKDANQDSTKWTASEAELHKLLALRGYHPLLPGQWKRDFYGYNLDEVLFAPSDCQLPTVLRNVSTANASQFRGNSAGSTYVFCIVYLS